MFDWLYKRRYSPIGVDIGSRSVKLVQLDFDRGEVAEAASWDLPADGGDDPSQCDLRIVDAIRRACDGRRFRGRDAVLCMNSSDVVVQNIRVPQLAGEELRKTVLAEAAPRLPFPRDEAEIRFLEAADVRQGEAVKREVIVLACRRPAVARMVALAEDAGLTPVGIDVEPTALVRCYARQFRRAEDQQSRIMFVNIGGTGAQIVMARGGHAMFIKSIDVGGKHFDKAVAKSLDMKLAEAASLRRHHGDRRANRRDPEVERTVADAVRGELERLGGELSLCLRYYSVAFRGEPIARVILSGGEATEPLAEWLAQRLDLPCTAGDPLGMYAKAPKVHRSGQWDIAAGLALWEAT